MYGDVASAINGQALIDAPADGAMVDNDVVFVHCTETVSLVMFNIFIAQAEAHETDDNVVGCYDKRIVGHTNTITWSRLSGNGDIVVLELHFLVQMDGAGYIEDDGTFSFLVDGITQGTWLVVVVEGCDVIDLTASSACGVHSEAFSAGEGGGRDPPRLSL